MPCTAVGKAGSKSYDVISFQGLLSKGSTKTVKLLICGIFENCKSVGVGSDTMWSIWRVLLWSLNCLFIGKWPECDADGNPYAVGTHEASIAGTELAGGYAAVIWILKADLDHLSKAYGLCHYNANRPCDFCPASAGEDAPVLMRSNCFRPEAMKEHADHA